MIYIISDTHGLYKRYEAMLKKIQLKDEDKLYVLGDVIDRGPQSFEILFDIMNRNNTEMFLGNHEHMMLTYLEGSDKESWFYGVNGGRETYRKFMTFDEAKKDEIVNYLKEKTTIIRNLEFENKRYILSHTSALTDGRDMFTKDYKDTLMYIQDIVWNMSADNIGTIPYKKKPDKETILISGHIVSRRLHDSDDVFIREYENGYTWMDIDCGCAMGYPYGQLSCVAISDEGEIENIYYVS
ncbi:MAG: fructose-bisphosphatase class III [Erysipelotrichaceae bacterium]|nr:fructose-bisphosphatase class III [Erysipelotrichaceae bacterium]